MKEYQDSSYKLLEFIEKSPCSYFAVENVRQELVQEGFREWKETESGEIDGDAAHFMIRNGSSLVAFRLPEECRKEKSLNGIRGFHIIASHCDSPSFKIKENPEITVEDQYVKLNTEKYGGMILSTWLDRPLSAAGRIALRGEGGIEEKLVNIGEDLMVIPNLAIHMNREMNQGIAYNAQVDMLPLYSGSPQSGGLLVKAAAAAKVDVKDIAGHDLFLYVREKGRIIGENGEFILSPRLDDLQCVYASKEAFFCGRPKDYINVLAVFDNEEVGSSTRQGADSTFLQDALSMIVGAFHGDGEELRRLVAGSFLISADNAHGVHPNHPGKADPTNRPYLNGGLVIKYHGSQRYTTDGISAAYIKYWCAQALVPYQTYTNRSDIVGGSTIGNISMAHVSLASADVGLPQLAMHSAVETAGVRDTEYALRTFKVFYEC